MIAVSFALIVQRMTDLTFHSKLIDLQGETISATEKQSLLTKLREILFHTKSGQMTEHEAASQIRQTAWKVAEDLRINDLDLSSGSDESILENLPMLLKI